MKRKSITVLLSMALLFSLVSCNETNSLSETLDETNNQTADISVQSSSTVEEEPPKYTIDDFVSEYNMSANEKLVFNEDFVVSDKQSGHYRTEFRLTAYANAIGKSYNIDDLVVDIISRESVFGNVDIRIYADGASLDQCIEMIKVASPLLDPTIDTNVISETIDYISERKEANGYYYGELGLLLLGNDLNGYSLLIKTD